MDVELDNETCIALLIGSVSLVILLLLMGFLPFYSWVISTLVAYGASVFFVVPIASGIIKRRFPKEYFVVSIFGLGALVVYAYFFSLTPVELVEEVVQTVIIVTIISTLFYNTRGYLEKRIPP